jgi:4-phospho-D-threonate 3-dehydrogenase / 4-phospho-D-erythronate 3-dehydrogenase
MPSSESLPFIGITMGDPTGIGPEIIVKALCAGEPFTVCRPVVFGDRAVLTRTAEMLGLTAEVEELRKIPQSGFHPGKIFLVPTGNLDPASIRYGFPDRQCGDAMVHYIIEAVRWVERGDLDALTTCPINKQAINLAGHHFSGHTELLGHLTRSPAVSMMFIGPRWKVILVTVHLPLMEVPKSVTRDRVLSKIEALDEGLRRFFDVSRPRIAVLGLNPHCGEEGLLGQEEQREIVPAIAEAKSHAIDVEGPFAADSFFDASSRGPFDAVVAMYHDQGLIPVKMAGFREAVNLTLGLPFIRTSVGHGTGYDIAGKGLADPTNLIRAITWASNLAKSKRNA